MANSVSVDQLFTILGEDDSLTMLALQDGNSLGVLFTSVDRARDFVYAYDLAPADIVELATTEELIGIAASYDSIDVHEVVLDPSLEGGLQDEFILDLDEVLTIEPPLEG
jgi:hypothetical protein